MVRVQDVARDDGEERVVDRELYEPCDLAPLFLVAVG